MYHYTCLVCQKQFSTNKSRPRKFCKRECFNKSKEKKQKECPTCNKLFIAQVPNAINCSRSCWHDAMKKRDLTHCVFCKKEIWFEIGLIITNKKPKYCSKECQWACKRDYNNQLDRLRKHFEQKVVKNDEGCWGWNGPLRQGGYGAATFNNIGINASRASWLIHNGPIPEGLLVLHTCDVSVCTNPAHLYIGNHKQNMDDRRERKRENMPKGTSHYRAMLSEEDIKAIKKMLIEGHSQKSIAELFNVNQSHISRIKSGEVWKSA